MDSIYHGNAKLDGESTRQWIVGAFMPETDIRHTKALEIKWGVHEKSEVRDEWAAEESNNTFSILISGQFVMEFPNKTVTLITQGDYVMWDKGIQHRWRAIENSVILTVRWPSVS